MSLESVRAFLAAKAPDLTVTVTDKSSATVALAAEALGVEPGQIAKTLSVRAGDRVVLVVTKGTARLDNKKAREALGAKPRMLGAEEVVALTGHPVGGVCPFGLATPLQVYCDVSLKEYAEVWPAAGSTNSSVRVTPDRMASLTNATWVDVAQEPMAVTDAASAAPE
ncbi:YbaK/EbsC family protein [Tardiphaga alba]|uniref:YbaK/EbsC family protein n=1 Tax=Tardiphaga alba TaxID=340268 RepID=A0ABX8ADK5_9BRAD|nr:YbaK/EbsC family protein [Tardiphaga alba]QUS41634.1 YbaK/EbsC family protein [Tardiphaga alba]